MPVGDRTLGMVFIWEHWEWFAVEKLPFPTAMLGQGLLPVGPITGQRAEPSSLEHLSCEIRSYDSPSGSITAHV